MLVQVYRTAAGTFVRPKYLNQTPPLSPLSTACRSSCEESSLDFLQKRGEELLRFVSYLAAVVSSSKQLGLLLAPRWLGRFFFVFRLWLRYVVLFATDGEGKICRSALSPADER